jgi:cell division protein FtsW
LEREKKGRQFDGILLILVVVLLVCGLIFLYSTSAYNGRVKFHDSAYYFKKQLFATSLGLMGMYLVSCMDYHILVKTAGLWYGISLVLSLMVLLFGDEYNGSKRWLSIGPLSFQPSEFAKVAVILLLTWVITRGEEKKRGIFYMAGTMALLLPIVGLVGASNLSTAIIILGIGVILIFVSNPRYLPFVGIGAAGVVFFWEWPVTVWSVWLSGGILRLMRKGSRPYRDFTP